ncbi:glycosyltransferase family 4 protein [Acetobacter sp. AN02]|uniref:glycosyltransferase family 4 protein n=1 Tax=Acetobacter sp. AN02 TaxID=2894186 RepID=UPI002434245A|nr:glycosyltransferase family 4 protein [Acetobacter sp. AN02]MDG6095371.1 glycosyltransferase family 4 protein [Acetobacter sp. AN02]
MSPWTDVISGPVVTILPPRERFAPGEAGAISLLVQRLAAADEIVIGRQPQGTPFQSCRFEAAVLPVLPADVWRGVLSSPSLCVRFADARYAGGVAALLRRFRPRLAEIHNRPELALILRRLFPDLPIRLVLHNDPQALRFARTPRARADLLRHVSIAAVSGWVRERFLSGLPLRYAADVCVLPNCIDIAALPDVMPQGARDRVILFAGRMVADKGADLFVRACARVLPQHPGWRAVMIGADRFGMNSPDTPFLQALRPEAAAAGITLEGYRPHDEVLQAMARSAIFVAPGRWSEPFGLVVLEAMACGAAVVASSRGGIPEVTGDAALLTEPDGLVEALDRLIRDPALRAGLAARGQERASLFDVRQARLRRAAAPPERQGAAFSGFPCSAPSDHAA